MNRIRTDDLLIANEEKSTYDFTTGPPTLLQTIPTQSGAFFQPGVSRRALRTSFATSAAELVKTLGHTRRGGVGVGTEGHASANGRTEVELGFD